MQGYELIFINKSTIKSSNFHYFSNNNQQKINFLLVITKESSFHYEINERNIYVLIFLNFMKK